jgi:hypothetical protein
MPVVAALRQSHVDQQLAGSDLREFLVVADLERANCSPVRT